MPVPGVCEKTLTTNDGTRLAYQVRGEGPAVVFSNGLGGTYTAWRHQYALLGEAFRIISWDYRGLFRSSRPRSLSSLAIDQQVADLRDILDAEGVDQAVLVGWSMGVQYNFEFYRQFPAKVLGIASFSGAAGRPFDDALGIPQIHRILPMVLTLARHAAALVTPLAQAATAWSGLIPLMERLGMVAPTLDRAVFDDIASEFAGLDFEAYIETFRHLGEHDCRSNLPNISVPTLVVCGTRDMLTPVKVAEALVARIPQSELALVEGGTHYVAVEFPEQVNRHLSRFMRRIHPGFLAAPQTTGD